ncbi:MAG TPA: mechanosensitive ion channel family protein [Ktedonobacterales bacterium]|nr:mechanosensitive ion channel family protein [Ktedonobacterales bacterium]
MQQAIATDPLIGARIGAIAVVAVGTLLLGRWLQRTASRFPLAVAARESADPDRPRKWRLPQTGTAVSRWVGRLAFLCVLAAGAELIAAIIGFGNPVDVGAALRGTAHDVIALAPRLTSALILIAVTLAGGRLAQRGVVRALDAAHADRSLRRLGGRGAYVTTLVVGAVIVLGIWGVPLAVPGAFLAVLTLALSLALQDVLRNLFAGVYLLVERPFLIGDEITVSDYSGRIEDIQLRVTSLRASDGERVLLPNALLFTSAVVNASANQRRRAVVAVSIPGDAPDARERASDAIASALAKISAVQLQPAPYVVLSGATQGKLELHAVFWVPANPSDAALAAISGAVDGIRTALPAADVSIVEPPVH